MNGNIKRQKQDSVIFANGNLQQLQWAHLTTSAEYQSGEHTELALEEVTFLADK